MHYFISSLWSDQFCDYVTSGIKNLILVSVHDYNLPELTGLATSLAGETQSNKQCQNIQNRVRTLRVSFIFYPKLQREGYLQAGCEDSLRVDPVSLCVSIRVWQPLSRRIL